MLGIVIENATIVDGSGTTPYVTDVGIVGERIALIGDLAARDAAERIPGTGMTLAPGFIDAHSHSDELWLALPTCDGKIRQGVTTEIGGNCGTSVAPGRGDGRAYGVDSEWNSFDEFFTLVERGGTALNVASLVGLGTTRREISGDSERRLERDEVRAQALLVREAVEQGAIGVSSGLIYPPSQYADTGELVALATAAREAGAPLYASHLRNEGDDLLDAVREALDIGRRAEVAVQFSHHKAAGRRNWGKVDASLQLIDKARAQGLAAYGDAYPYVASWTEFATILPPDARFGGADETLKRLADPETAAAIALNLELRHAATWKDMLITSVGSEKNAGLAGRRFDEIARAWRMSPARAAIELLRDERLEVEAAFFTMSEDDVATVYSAEFVCVGSDASARALRGVTARGVPHPRTFGTFPRVFGRYVRGRKTFTLEEAVRRMTSLPAAIFGLRDRGSIEVGRYADLVLFDGDAIVDTATYEQPYAYPRGIDSVFVNGTRVVANGEITGALPGRVLRFGRDTVQG